MIYISCVDAIYACTHINFYIKQPINVLLALHRVVIQLRILNVFGLAGFKRDFLKRCYKVANVNYGLKVRQN